MHEKIKRRSVCDPRTVHTLYETVLRLLEQHGESQKFEVEEDLTELVIGTHGEYEEDDDDIVDGEVIEDDDDEIGELPTDDPGECIRKDADD